MQDAMDLHGVGDVEVEEEYDGTARVGSAPLARRKNPDRGRKKLEQASGSVHHQLAANHGGGKEQTESGQSCW